MKRLILIGLVVFIAAITLAQESIKNHTGWQQYTNVEDVGFSNVALDLVKAKVDSLDTAALLVVYKGNVLLSYGETTRKFMLHSVRKSLLNAMIGIEVEKGTIGLEQTLADLGIDDIGLLTAAEKKATVRDLLSARSGVYLPSAYATQGMIASLPERGTHKPGSYWFYNNWDFNVLLTIYEQQSHKHFFEAFKNEIADPIGMEDFDLGDTFYRYEKDKSIHPAYLFRMSAKDMARFGLLYLNRGIWEGKPIVPSTWIAQSTQTVSTDLDGFDSREAYGFLWWVKTVNGKPMYYASGSGGQRIMVFPEDDLVIVHRTNTYENYNVDDVSIDNLVSRILDAKLDAPAPSNAPELIPFQPEKTVLHSTYSGTMDHYLGTYTHRFLGDMAVEKSEGGYFLDTQVGTFKLYPTSDHSFITEDIEIPMVLTKADETHNPFTIAPVMKSRKSIKEMVFYY